MAISPLSQTKENRRHKLEAWLSREDGTRWVGDDGRFLRLDEFMIWPQEIKDAEAAYFAVIDAEYEAEKAAL